jgi:hypothetical protein
MNKATQQMNEAKQQMNEARLASGSTMEGRDDFYEKNEREIRSPVAMNCTKLICSMPGACD